MQKLLEFESEHSLASQLPYWDFLENTIVLADGSLASGLKLHGISLETMDNERVNQLTLEWRSILNSLNDGLELGFLSEVNSDWEKVIADHEMCHAKDLAPEISWLAKDRVAKLREGVKIGTFLKTNLTLFVYRRFQGESAQPFWKTFFKSPRHFTQVKRQDHELAEKELSQATDALKMRLENCGIKAEYIQGIEAWNSIYHFLNPERHNGGPPPKPSNAHRTQEFTAEELNKCPELTHASPREGLVPKVVRV